MQYIPADNNIQAFRSGLDLYPGISKVTEMKLQISKSY